MQKPQVIAIIGMAGSGKGTVVEHLVEAYQIPKVYFGGMVYEEVERRGLNIIRDERAVREDMRATDGPAVLAKRAATRAKEELQNGARFVVLDGVYSWSEDCYLREIFGDAYSSIAIVTPKHVRYDRVVTRKDAHRTYTRDDIKRRDIEEIEFHHKGDPIAFADYYLLNASSIDALKAATDDIMHQLGY